MIIQTAIIAIAIAIARPIYTPLASTIVASVRVTVVHQYNHNARVYGS